MIEVANQFLKSTSQAQEAMVVRQSLMDGQDVADEASLPLHPDLLKPLIVRSVDSTIRQAFPKKYFGLCHVYAIVGSSLTSAIFGREFRPVAGLAVIDMGAGCMLKLLENEAFARSDGGAYHCWIESCPGDSAEREFVDLIYQHNSAYAKKHKLIWRKGSSGYLWGAYSDHVIGGELHELPTRFPDGKLWLKETAEGLHWMDRHVASHVNEYVKITSLALRRLLADLNQRQIDVGSAVFATT